MFAFHFQPSFIGVAALGAVIGLLLLGALTQHRVVQKTRPRRYSAYIIVGLIFLACFSAVWTKIGELRRENERETAVRTFRSRQTFDPPVLMVHGEVKAIEHRGHPELNSVVHVTDEHDKKVHVVEVPRKHLEKEGIAVADRVRVTAKPPQPRSMTLVAFRIEKITVRD